jgi:sugar/nucleoside kinase (ribokinase family)
MVDVVVLPLGPFHPGSDTSCRIAVTPGGSATNQAVALAAAGAEAHLVAVVGDDELGPAAARALAGTGVRAYLAARPGERTGVVVALVDASGQRSMLTDRGANRTLQPGDVPAGLLRTGAHLHLSGYELLDEESRQAGRATLDRAAGAGMTRSVDLCSAGPLQTVGGEAFLAWTEGLDWCFANLEEGRALTGATGPGDVLGALAPHYGEVVLTLGAQGALCSSAGVAVHRPAQTAVVADTTGAGDAFSGTFLAHRLRGEDVATALGAGLAAAARVVPQAGARSWPGGGSWAFPGADSTA